MNKDKIISGLSSQFPKLVEICENFENEEMKDMYNPHHPARLSKLRESVIPASELRRLGVQIAIENPEKWSDLVCVHSPKWMLFGDIAKKVAVYTNWIGKDILEMANNFSLREFMLARCPHLFP